MSENIYSDAAVSGVGPEKAVVVEVVNQEPMKSAFLTVVDCDFDWCDIFFLVHGVRFEVDEIAVRFDAFFGQS